MNNAHILEQLDVVLQTRRSAAAGDSYAASLYRQGTQAILDKVNEEAAEVVAAGANESDARLSAEIADLWFHCQVLLAHRNIRVNTVFAELEKRFGTSGLEEKKQRGA